MTMNIYERIEYELKIANSVYESYVKLKYLKSLYEIAGIEKDFKRYDDKMNKLISKMVNLTSFNDEQEIIQMFNERYELEHK